MNPEIEAEPSVNQHLPESGTGAFEDDQKPHDRPARRYDNVLSTIVTGGGVSLIANVLIIVIGLVFQIVLARNLGAERVGVFSLGFTLFNFAAIFVLVGLPNGMMRFVSVYSGQEDERSAADVFIIAIRIVGLTSIVFAPLLFLASNWIALTLFKEPELVIVIRILAIALPVSTLADILLSYMQGYRRVDLKAVVEVAKPLSKTLLVLPALFVFSLGVAAPALAVLGSQILAFAIAGYFVFQLHPRADALHKPDPELRRKLLSFSLPLLLTGILLRANSQSETIVLGLLSTTADVGIYVTGLKITAIVILFLQALNIIFAPVAGNLFGQHDMDGMLMLYQTTTRWAFTLSIPIFLVCILLAPELMSIFGKDFIAGAIVVQVLAISQIINVLTGPSGNILIIAGYPQLNLVNFGVTLGLAVIFDVILIPTYGALGAGLAGMISIIFVNLLKLVEVHILLKMQPYTRSYWKPFVAGTITGLVTWWIMSQFHSLANLPTIIATMGIIVLVYVGLLLVFRLEEEDKRTYTLLRRQPKRLG